jgi:hypothetical protein
MAAAVHRKIIIGTILIGSVVFFSDVLFDSVLWATHMVFEIIEFSLEMFVVYVFHTEHHESEIIGLYILLVIILFVLYRMLGRIHSFIRWCNEKFSSFWQTNKTGTLLYWHELSVLEKIKLVSVGTICLSCLLFLLTL